MTFGDGLVSPSVASLSAYYGEKGDAKDALDSQDVSLEVLMSLMRFSNVRYIICQLINFQPFPLKSYGISDSQAYMPKFEQRFSDLTQISYPEVDVASYSIKE